MMAQVGPLILHIGDPKTGTTAIQDVLATRSFSLDGEASGKRLLYTTGNNHNRLARSFYRKDLVDSRPELLGGVAARMREAPEKAAILSAEAFDFAEPELVHAELSALVPERMEQLRVIAYVRPHASRFLSAYAERIKTGEFSGSPDKLWKILSTRKRLGREHVYMEFAPRFERWRRVFGDRFELYPFLPSELAEGDVVRDFLGRVFPGAALEITPPEVSNPSLSLGQLAMLEHLHAATRGKGKLRVARRSLGWITGRALSFSQADTESGKPWLHRALSARIVEACAQDAARLDAEFFGGRPLMGAALERAHAQARPEPMGPLADYMGADARSFAEAFGLLTLEMMTADAPAFTRMINAAEGPMIRKTFAREP